MLREKQHSPSIGLGLGQRMFGKRVFSAIIAACAYPVTAEPLTIDSVVSLHNAGVGDDAVIAKIKNSSSAFELSTNQMISHTGRGLSGPVLAAMLNAGGDAKLRPTPMSADSPDPMVPHSTGVYLLADWTDSPKMVRIDATVSNQAMTGGVFGYASQVASRR